MVGGKPKKEKRIDRMSPTAGEVVTPLVPPPAASIKEPPLPLPRKVPSRVPTISTVSEAGESLHTTSGAFDVRQDAQRKDLIVVCKLKTSSIPQQWVPRRQTFWPTEKPGDSSNRHKIESAQVYFEGFTVINSAPLELVQRPDSSSALELEGTRNKQLLWL